MAITAPHYRLLKEHAHLIPRGGSLLEIGEANWYWDMDPLDMLRDTKDQPTRRRIHLAVAAGDTFGLAKACYAVMFAPAIVEAIDLHGPNAQKLDLNRPVDLPRTYDLCINHGTAEHIFNIAQVFRTMHDWTKPGGLMIHEGPFTGWLDHGFYCLQPTLYYDLAAANGYEVVSMSITEIASNTIQRLERREHLSRLAKAGKVPMNAMLFVVLRKVEDSPFCVPMQGVYSNGLSDEGRKAWRELR
jgi:hypothetical protein